MAGTKTREQLEAEWWAWWWDADFTWDGLAKRNLKGWVVADGSLREADSGRIYGQPAPDAPAPVEGNQATLQDYWRADPATGRLRADSEMGEEWVAAPDQPLFHRIHLPLAWKDGTPTGKADWADDSLDSLAGPRLIAATDTAWRGEIWGRSITDADGRGQLGGAVLLSGLTHLVGNTRPHLSVDASGTNFVRTAIFESATFSGDADFNNATFSSNATFAGATFSGDARFEGATFSEGAHFDSSGFSGDADFNNATFSSNATFAGATFSSSATFDGATFSGYARFNGATFSGDARFEGATFSGAARFSYATFSGDARFDDSGFHHSADFKNASFEKAASFQRCLFAELAWFDGSAFRSDMDFTAAVFDRLASFERIAWPDAARDWHSAFDQTLFRGTLNLYSAGVKAFAALDGTTLERGLQFDEADESAAQKTFRAERAGAIAAAKADAGAFETSENERRTEAAKAANAKPVPVSKAEKQAWQAAERDARLRELERGLRVLKLAMEKSSNKSREQLFYRFELQARRAQKKLPLGEKTFSYLYAASSDYGASMWRPFVALTVLIAAFAAIFYAWGYGFDAAALKVDGWNGVFQALDLSWSNVFKPLSALSTENDFRDKNALAFRLLYNDAGGVDGQGFAVRALSTLQSLLALVLAFLFALAVRRRFQIS